MQVVEKAYTMLQIAFSLFPHLFRKFCWSCFSPSRWGPFGGRGPQFIEPSVAMTLLVYNGGKV